MPESTKKRFWMKSLLTVLVLLTAIGTTTLITMQQYGASAAGAKKATPTPKKGGKVGAAASGPNASFTVTNGDTYKFVNSVPTSYSGQTVNFGTWSVTDTTTKANLGNLSGTLVSKINSSTQVEGTLHGSFPLIGTNINSDQIAYPGDPLPGQQDGYLSGEGVYGEELISDTLGANGALVPTVEVHHVEDPKNTGTTYIPTTTNSPLYKAVEQAVATEKTGMIALDGVHAMVLPAQANHGGGPLAISRAQRPALAPLAIYLIGLALTLGGVAVSSVCAFKTCSNKVKGTLAIVGALLTMAGSAVTGLSNYSLATSTAASAAQLAQGFELTSAAVTEGAAMTSAQLTSIQESLALLSTSGMTIAGA